MFSDIPAGNGKIANLFYSVGTGRDDRGRVKKEGNEAAWKDKGREEKKWGGGVEGEERRKGRGGRC